eukprot:7355692-Prymnesium_polylepis.1
MRTSARAGEQRHLRGWRACRKAGRTFSAPPPPSCRSVGAEARLAAGGWRGPVGARSHGEARRPSEPNASHGQHEAGRTRRGNEEGPTTTKGNKCGRRAREAPGAMQ